MRIAFVSAIALAAGLAIGPAASAQSAPAQTAPVRTDPRIRVILYNPNAVVSVDAAFGFQMMIQFGPDERIENVSIGDGSAWQVTPNKAASLLFIKPVDIATRTNMTVVTDRRSYLFELNARTAGLARSAYGDPIYVMRFTYPADKASAPVKPPPPERRNTAYSYTGARSTLPAEVFDDGKFTYFRWPEQVSVPALFLAAADGSESLVNYSVRDGFQVVEQTAPRFVLRNGKDVTVVINGGWREPVPPPEAPQPADARTARSVSRVGGAAK